MTASSSSSSTSSVHHLFTFAPSSLSRISKSRRHQDNKHTMALCHQHQTMAPQKRSNNKQVQTDFTATSPTTMTTTTTSTTSTTEWTFESVNFKVCQKNGVAKVTAAASSPLLFNNSQQQQRHQMTCNNNNSNNGFGQFQYGNGSGQAKRVTTQHHPLQELEEEELELEMTTTGGGGEQEGGQESNVLRIQQRKIHATGFASHWVLQTAGSSSSSSSSSSSASSPSSQHKSKQQTRRKVAATVTATTTESSKSGMEQTGGDEQQRWQKQNSVQQWQQELQNQEEQQRQPLQPHHNRWAEEQREIIDAMYSILEAYRHKQRWGSDPDIIGSGDSHRWLEEQNSTAHALNSQNGTNRPLRIRDMLN